SATTTSACRGLNIVLGPSLFRIRLRWKACLLGATAREGLQLQTTAPMMLFGVEAPAVRPTTIGPSTGSQSRDAISTNDGFGAPAGRTGRWRMAVGERRPSGSAM